MEVLQPFCAPAPVSDPPLKTKKVFPFARVGFPLLQLVTAASCPSSLLSLNKPIFYHKGGETLEWVAQRGSGGPIPANIQGQVGRRSEQPGLVEDVPAHCRGVGPDDLCRSLPTQSILWFYDPM